MNILIDRVPEAVEIDGEEYEINTDFRVSILFEMLMQDMTILDNEKMELALELYYPEIPRDLIQAVDRILWFYSCGVDRDGAAESTEKGPKMGSIYSFEHDAEYIYAAFLDQYGIDLQDIEYLHWWKFRALFKSLKEDTLMSKIMGYRAMTIDSDMSDREKNYYRNMKQIYSLPDLRTEEEKEMDFHDTIASMI